MRLLALALVGILPACAALAPVVPSPAAPPSADRYRLERVPFSSLPGWDADTHSAALPALLRSCERRLRRPPDEPVGPDGIAGVAGDWAPVCLEARKVAGTSDQRVRYFLESQFAPYRVDGRDGPWGLFTGYYEPKLRGSRTADARHRVPIYRRPPDLVSVNLGSFRSAWRGRHVAGRQQGDSLVPYPTRAEIEDGGLNGRRLELLWVDDPIDAFFLHIQGSGRVVMQDGGVVRLGYAGRNGHPYVPIGRELVARGVVSQEDLSAEAVRSWLESHPAAGTALMRTNPSFVFFRVLEEDHPVGAEGVPLTPGRSLAVDTRFLPLGVPVWIDTLDPVEKTPLRRLVMAQDTGSAIRGPVRGDLFWGFGASAAKKAGSMKERGRYYLLLPQRRSR